MNPKFDFYSALLNLFKNGYDEDLAKKVLVIYQENSKKISVAIAEDRLRQWVVDYTNEDYLEDVQAFVEFAFEDLAPQMREESVRHLISEWKKIAKVEDDWTLAHVRKALKLGDKAAVITLVVDDLEKFKSVALNGMSGSVILVNDKVK